MKLKVKYYWILPLLFWSCNSWIDITPSDRLSEDMLFENRQGFEKAINGVYVGLVDRSLYGRTLSAGSIDLMGQYYNYGSGTDINSLVAKYMYEYDDDVKLIFQNVWEKAYALIVNCNIIIEKCDTKREVLPDVYYGIYKGEALALRAMLHLDILRLFGPVYDETTKSEECLPYVTNSNTEISPLISAEEFLGKVISDLEEAAALLKNTDPIITEGVRNGASPTGDNSLYYRQYRLNYYAVNALLARAYLWGHDKGNALKVAEEILTEVQVEESEIFPFVTNSAATNASNPDRIFSTEVMFSLYDSYREAEIYDALFVYTLDNLYTLPGEFLTSGPIKVLYDDENDYRYKMWATNTTAGETVLYCRKYQDVNASYNYMIPLVRLSEVYLIAAECTDDLEIAQTYLNKVRTSRGCFSLTSTQESLLDDITDEFRREFLGEGQMFFFYKRHNMSKIPNGRDANGTGTIDMLTSDYVVSLPDSETNVRID